MEIPIQWIGNGSLVAIVATFIYAILKGYLVPSRLVDQIREDGDKNLASMEAVVTLWREGAEINKQAIAELVPLVKEGLDNDRTTVALVTGMKAGLDSDRVENLARRRDVS